MLKNSHSNYSIIPWPYFIWKFWEDWQLVQISLLVHDGSYWELTDICVLFSTLCERIMHIFFTEPPQFWCLGIFILYVDWVVSLTTHTTRVVPLKVRDSLWLLVIWVKKIVILYCILYHCWRQKRRFGRTNDARRSPCHIVSIGEEPSHKRV
jgi:hypothetical protein